MLFICFTSALFLPRIFLPFIFLPFIFFPFIFLPSIFLPSIFLPSIFRPLVFFPFIFLPFILFPFIFLPSFIFRSTKPMPMKPKAKMAPRLQNLVKVTVAKTIKGMGKSGAGAATGNKKGPAMWWKSKDQQVIPAALESSAGCPGVGPGPS